MSNPAQLKQRIARALQVIALSMNEEEYFEQFDEDE